MSRRLVSPTAVALASLLVTPVAGQYAPRTPLDGAPEHTRPRPRDAASDAPARPATPSSHEIRLAGGDRRHLVVEATVNGVVSGPMLLDTGASYCVLTRTTARRLGLEPTGTSTVPVVTANGTVAADLVRLGSMQLSGARLRSVDALILDAVEPPLIGIVGLSFLSQFRFSIDHAQGTLRLER